MSYLHHLLAHHLSIQRAPEITNSGSRKAKDINLQVYNNLHQCIDLNEECSGATTAGRSPRCAPCRDAPQSRRARRHPDALTPRSQTTMYNDKSTRRKKQKKNAQRRLRENGEIETWGQGSYTLDQITSNPKETLDLERFTDLGVNPLTFLKPSGHGKNETGELCKLQKSAEIIEKC